MNLKWVSGNSNLFKGTKMFHLVGASKSRISRICVVFTSDLGFDSECSLSKSNFSFIVLEQHPINEAWQLYFLQNFKYTTALILRIDDFSSEKLSFLFSRLLFDCLFGSI